MHFCMCGMKQSKNQASPMHQKNKKGKWGSFFSFFTLGKSGGLPERDLYQKCQTYQNCCLLRFHGVKEGVFFVFAQLKP